MCNSFVKSKKQYFSDLYPKLITNNENYYNKPNKLLFLDKLTIKEIINVFKMGKFSAQSPI